ncbi:hypothetical protein AKJ57_03720 [candidate division MSBL1 archaeon SCGC-AAA259A05]|uniref:Uncharacterized protein n=1 Tax=candidate division MSBL1 archaeon SCGC-AAA259A05 TaxID=1698259 RepID=A0A133U9C9_9EURY|nr:hypothetical protein AKJ57_03720 [candidate division MSBL1 archaeon SCGC-AAA259A05]
MIFSPKGFDILYSFIIASAYLHHRVENDKVRVTEKDVDYIKDLFERYFKNIALAEYEEMRGEELLFAEELVDQLTANQKKLLKSLSEGSKPRSEVAEELAVAPESVSRMLHQQTKYDSTTNERYYSGAELVEGKRPLIKRRGNDYELTEFGWLVVSDYLLCESSQEEIVQKILKFYEQYGDPEWTVSQFLNTLEEQFKDIDREDLKPYVLKLKEEGKITLQDGMGEIEEGCSSDV